MSLLPFTYQQRRSWFSNRCQQVLFYTTIGFCLVILALVMVAELLVCVPRSLVEKYDKAHAMHTSTVISRDGKVYRYDRSSPLIFISGVNTSGSDYLRDVLNYHPDIRCNSERHIIPKILRMRCNWYKSKNESRRLIEGGLSKHITNVAIAAFILELMAGSGDPVKYLCTEDFQSVKYAEDLSTIFPQSKFLLIVRDPLHYAHAKMRNVTTFNETLFHEYLAKWDYEMQQFTTVCNRLVNWDQGRCLMINYELLFLRPKPVVRRILDFIFGQTNKSHPDIPEAMKSNLKPGAIDYLLEWVNHVPKSVIQTIGPKRYEVVDKLGYGHIGYPPNYMLLPRVLG